MLPHVCKWQGKKDKPVQKDSANTDGEQIRGSSANLWPYVCSEFTDPDTRHSHRAVSWLCFAFYIHSWSLRQAFFSDFRGLGFLVVSPWNHVTISCSSKISKRGLQGLWGDEPNPPPRAQLYGKCYLHSKCYFDVKVRNFSFINLLLANIRFKGKEEKKQGHSLGFVEKERLFPESRDQLRHLSLAPLPEENQVVFM